MVPSNLGVLFSFAGDGLRGCAESVPVPAEETEALQATGAPGLLCVGRLFPQCPLLQATSPVKAESILGSRRLDHILQMMGNVTLERMSLLR